MSEPPSSPHVPSDRRIVHTFVDGTTGYEVILHLGEGDTRVHTTLVDRRTGTVVPITQRAKEIPSGEQIRIDESHGLRITTRHTIDANTGYESLYVEISDATTGALLSRGSSTALRAAGEPDEVERYLASRAMHDAEERFWRDEYPTWDFAKRAIHWADMIRRQRRSQEEFGLDEFDIFTPEAYAIWRKREPEIDRILDIVAERAGGGAEMNRRLGRENPKPPSKRKAR